MYPIVNILCSPLTMNTHSWKWNIAIQSTWTTLPSTFNISLHSQTLWITIQVIQGDMTSYDLQDIDEDNIAGWRKMKVKEVRAKQMRRIRRRVEVLQQLKRELRQVHKLSQTESGFPGICWWHLKYWYEDLGLKVKSSPTLTLDYPSKCPTTPSCCYHSLDPNNFENWGDLATA